MRWGKSHPHLAVLPINACGPGGRGAEGRGDIIRAAPPPAATSPRARRSIHDIIGLISTPLPPRDPSSGTRPLPSSGSGPTSLAVQWAPRQVGAERDAVVGLSHLLAASGSGAGSSAPTPPARLAGAARSPPGGARGAGPAPLRAPPAPRPGPAHPRLRQTWTRPPATPPEATNPGAGAERSALTPWSLRPSLRLRPLCLNLLQGAASLPQAPFLVAGYPPRPLGSAPSLSNKSSGTTPSLNPTSLATVRSTSGLGKELPTPSPEPYSSPASDAASHLTP